VFKILLNIIAGLLGLAFLAGMGLLVYGRFTQESVTYVNASDNPLLFISQLGAAYESRSGNTSASSVVVPPHGETQVTWPKYGPGIRVMVVSRQVV
jgi:hypothetical protein